MSKVKAVFVEMSESRIGFWQEVELQGVPEQARPMWRIAPIEKVFKNFERIDVVKGVQGGTDFLNL